MSDSTPRLGLPDLPDTPELYAETVADAFWRLDALCDLYLKGQFVNTPPASPADGDVYLLGGAPTGAWSGYAYKIAAARDGGWQFLTPFDGLRAWVDGTGCFIVYQDGSWTDWNALISAAEGSIASAATCDIGGAGALFLQVTGTTTITALGTVANRMRFLRFAGALTLTHNATSLILPGAANIATAAGDTALFASDGSGNWRCRAYARADGRMVNMASPAFSGTVAIGAGGSASGLNVNSAFVNGYGQVNVTASDSYGYVSMDGPSGSGLFFRRANALKWEQYTDSGGGLAFHNHGTPNAEAFRAGADNSFLVGTTTATGAGTIGTHVYTVAALPAGAKGARAFVSDATSASFAAAAAGGGGNNVPVYHDGSGWRIG